MRLVSIRSDFSLEARHVNLIQTGFVQRSIFESHTWGDMSKADDRPMVNRLSAIVKEAWLTFSILMGRVMRLQDVARS